MPDDQQMTALLGRPLTASESAGFQGYLDAAVERLEQMLGVDLKSETATRTFFARRGYGTVHTDPFTAATLVEVNDNATTAYLPMQGDRFNAPWFDSLSFTDPVRADRIRVTATWGFGAELPADLAALLAGMFAIVATPVQKGTDARVASKRTEDFSVTFRDVKEDSSPLTDLATLHGGTIAKYSRQELYVL